jgi:hypothetical protein
MLECGKASACSREAGDLNFLPGEISQFLNVTKSLKDLKDLKKNGKGTND